MPCVRLISINYSEGSGTPKEWVLDNLSLKQLNLLVGKNATGKTRTLNVINGLARILTASPRFIVQNGTYDVLFDNNGESIRYKLKLIGGLVVSEQYIVNEKVVLNRGLDSDSEIELHIPGQATQMVKFSPPANEPAALVKRDLILHPYLETLHQWVEATRYYTFGTPLGRETVAIIAKDAPEVDDRDFNQVVGIFRKAERQFGPDFTDAVKLDMTRMGYKIDSIELVASQTLKIQQGNGPTELSVIGIKEEGLNRIIEQLEMSQGMFRALSILIQVNYSQMANRASCILIDDIGEGLDFERSTNLISLLREKAETSNFQLIMSTNDRFVMNNVPLSEWSVLQRNAGIVTAKNYENSKELFDQFKFTGLSNFSFFEMDFLNNTDEEADGNEEEAAQ